MPNVKHLLDELASFRDASGAIVVRETTGLRIRSLRARNGILLNFAFLEEVDTDDARAVIAYIRYQVTHNSADHSRNCLGKLAAFLSSREYFEASNHLSAIFAYRTKLQMQRLEYNLHYIRDWWMWAADQGFDGFDDGDVRWALEDIVIGGNAKGVAVLRADPDQGPLFDSEESSIRGALHNSNASIDDIALAWLFMSHGFNPMNVALLLEEDLNVDEIGDQRFYSLHVPRIKKRIPHRTDFVTRKLDPFLGQLLVTLIESNSQRISNGSPRPMFWASNTSAPAHWPEYACNCSSHELASNLSRFFESLQVVSPESGEIIHITPRRFRYSFAARVVRQGASIQELVQLLDHSDAQNVLVYFRNRHQQRALDAAAAKRFGPIASRFLGKLVLNEVAGGGSPRNRIKTINLLDLGTCGNDDPCDKYPPRACYLCPKMIAWKDGAHEQFLADTVAVNRADPRGAVQLDDVILAIGQVVEACKV